MYPRGRKVCFATAGFLLIAKTRIYLRSCGIPSGKKRAGLACGIGNILRAGRPGGGQPSFPGRLAGRREAAAKRGAGNAPWRRRKETIERVFADAKEKQAMRYTQYRGLAQVSNWVKLKFAARNLKKLARWLCQESLDSLYILLLWPLHDPNPAYA